MKIPVIQSLSYAMAAAIIALPQCLFAGPPFLTDDPETVEYRHQEFYIATQQVRTRDGKTGTLPHIEFNYGVVPDVQLHVLVPYVYNASSGSYQRGVGDTEIGAKYRFVHETETSPMVGIFPIAILNTGNQNKGLGNGSTQLFLPIWFQKRWGTWQSYCGGGYWITHTADCRNHWFYGWQLQKEVTEQLVLGGELFHRTEDVYAEGSSTGYNVGGNYSFDEHNHLLFSLGRGLSNTYTTNQLSSYLGYQWTW